MTTHGNTDTVYTAYELAVIEWQWNCALILRLRQIRHDPTLLSPGMRMRAEQEARALHQRAMRQLAEWRRFLNEHFEAA
jgi:orotidine-5'-phosphate decarboxylase